MNLDTYQQAAATTAGGDHREERSILGIYGEREEYENDPEQDTDELGDVAWYIAECCTAHDLRLSDCLDAFYGEDVNLAEARKKWLRGDFSKRAPGPSWPDKMRQARMTYLRRVSSGVATQWHWLEAECKRRNLSLDSILRANIHKLEGRKQRGTITGDGHDR